MSEFIDLYDQNRKLLNREVDRTTYLFQPGEFMMYVLAILENSQGEFLVTQRAFNKKWAAGNWEMPGGGAKSKESSLDAIKREVKEETGLDVEFVEGFRKTIAYSPRIDCMKTEVLFLAYAEHTDARAQEEEVRAIQWLPFENAVEALTFDSTREILRQADAFLNG